MMQAIVKGLPGFVFKRDTASADMLCFHDYGQEFTLSFLYCLKKRKQKSSEVMKEKKY